MNKIDYDNIMDALNYYLSTVQPTVENADKYESMEETYESLKEMKVL